MAKTKAPLELSLEHPVGVDHERRRRKVKDYDPAEFFVESTDHQGHNDQYRFRAPKGYNRRMDEIIASKKFPFVTSSDILRYCLHIGLRRLDRMEASSTVQQQLEVMRQIMAEARFQQEFVDTYKALEKVIERHLEQDDRGAARNVVSRILHQIRRMPDETNWRKRYEDELMQRYGALLNEGRNRKLAKLVKEPE